MKWVWERGPRVPRLPLWAVALGSVWLVLVLAGVLLERRGAPELETCLLHRLTGHACPTCGSTRVGLDMARGAWREALHLNPLVTVGLALGGLWLGIRLVSGRVLRLDLSPMEQRLALALGLTALFANWMWVLRVQG